MSKTARKGIAAIGVGRAPWADSWRELVRGADEGVRLESGLYRHSAGSNRERREVAEFTCAALDIRYDGCDPAFADYCSRVAAFERVKLRLCRTFVLHERCRGMQMATLEVPCPPEVNLELTVPTQSAVLDILRGGGACRPLQVTAYMGESGWLWRGPLVPIQMSSRAGQDKWWYHLYGGTEGELTKLNNRKEPEPEKPKP